MKQPRPSAPADAPVGTVTLGGPLEWFSAALQVSGEHLDPATITKLLGCEPTHSQVRGVAKLREDGSLGYVPKFGRWARTIKPRDSDEWDIAQVVRDLFAGLPASSATWEDVTRHGHIRVALGLSIQMDSQDFGFDAALMRFLADRFVSVWFDVYRESESTNAI